MEEGRAQVQLLSYGVRRQSPTPAAGEGRRRRYTAHTVSVRRNDHHFQSHPVSYSFLATNGLPSQIDYRNSFNQSVMKREMNYDRLKRLTNVVHSAYKNSVWETTASFGYQFNAAGQRTIITVQGSDYTRPAAWEFGYDPLGQVTSGHKRFDDGTLAAGLPINPLNQYTSRSVPNYISVSGTANADATVTLIDSAGDCARALRQGEHFFGELAVNNSTGAVWLTITNFAVLDSGGQQITTNINGSILVPPAQHLFQHDADGNLTNDAVWVRTWNAENRVTRIESAATVPLAAKKREDWKYLPDGRWIERIVSTNNGSAYHPAYTNRFVWDGQVLLAILDNRNVPTVTFMRGQDLSGTVHGLPRESGSSSLIGGAGGVGGLLGLTSYSGQPSTLVVSVDGNGNVVGLADIASGETTAVYEYGPFGEVLRMTGDLAKTNPFRFSTKYQDDETDLLHYGYRYYNASTGRWISRDPIEETGGLNLYGFTENNPVSRVDMLGLWGEDLHEVLTAELARMAGFCDPRRIGIWANKPDKDYRDPIKAGFSSALGSATKYPTLFTVAAPLLMNAAQQWHFPMDSSGIVVPGSEVARAKPLQAIKDCDLKAFAEGLHVLQDSWSHQGRAMIGDKIGHWRGVKEIHTSVPSGAASVYVKGFGSLTAVSPVNYNQTRYEPLEGFSAAADTSADDMRMWPADVRNAMLATYELMLAFKENCKCSATGTRCGEAQPSRVVSDYLKLHYPGKNKVDLDWTKLRH